MLDISRTKVTDVGLLELRDLTNLKTIYLYGTPVTDAGVFGLKEELPNLSVYR